jgi:hypothetical protein
MELSQLTITSHNVMNMGADGTWTNNRVDTPSKYFATVHTPEPSLYTSSQNGSGDEESGRLKKMHNCELYDSRMLK